MKRLLALMTFFLFISYSALAQNQVTAEMLNESLSKVSLNKEQIKMMVDVMVAQGQVSPQNGEKTKKEIDSLSEQELQNVIKQAMTQIKKSGAESLKGDSLNDALKSLGQ